MQESTVIHHSFTWFMSFIHWSFSSLDSKATKNSAWELSLSRTECGLLIESLGADSTVIDCREGYNTTWPIYTWFDTITTRNQYSFMDHFLNHYLVSLQSSHIHHTNHTSQALLQCYIRTWVRSMVSSGIFLPTSSGEAQHRIWFCRITHHKRFQSGRPPTILCREVSESFLTHESNWHIWCESGFTLLHIDVSRM